MKFPSPLVRLAASRHGGSLIFIAVFLGISLLARVALLLKSAGEVGWDASLVAAFLCGFVYDLAAAGLWSLPLSLLLTFLPAGCFARRWAAGARPCGGSFHDGPAALHRGVRVDLLG
jgi:hypothetical protein